MTDRLIKAFDKFNQDVKAFAQETGDEFAILYEDIYTTRSVKDFKLYKNGNLHYIENNFPSFGQVTKQIDTHFDEDDVRDSLRFWRAALRRAKRYWETDCETLDKMADGEIPDIADED